MTDLDFLELPLSVSLKAALRLRSILSLVPSHARETPLSKQSVGDQLQDVSLLKVLPNTYVGA